MSEIATQHQHMHVRKSGVPKAFHLSKGELFHQPHAFLTPVPSIRETGTTTHISYEGEASDSTQAAHFFESFGPEATRMLAHFTIISSRSFTSTTISLRSAHQ